MKNKIPDIYIITCDETVWITYFTTRLINKYLKNINIYILGYNDLVKNYESNVTFISLGIKRNIKTWFKDIYNYLKKINNEIIFIILDDYPFNDDIDLNYLDFAIDYILNNDVALIHGTYHNKTYNKNIKISEDNDYLIENQCTHPNIWLNNIWKTECFLELLNTNFNKYKTLNWMINNYKISNKNTNDEDMNNYINTLVKFEYYGKQIISKNFSNYKFIMIKNKKLKNYNLLSSVQYGGLLSRNSRPNLILLLYLKKEDIKMFYDNEYNKYDITYGNTFKITYDNYNEIVNNNNFYNEVIKKNYPNDINKQKTLKIELEIMNII